MPAGRPRKPTNLRVLEGNPSKRPLPEGEPDPRIDDENPSPEWLRDVAGAVDVWDRLAEELAAVGLLTVLDRSSLAGLCVSYAVWRESIKACESEGYTIMKAQTHGGEPVRVKNPSWTVAKEALADFTKISARFGMTPSDRAGLATGGANKGDPLDDLVSALRESRTA